jgi:hypothetical protein
MKLMHNILKVYSYIKNLFLKPKSKETPLDLKNNIENSLEEEYIGGLSFKVTLDGEIDISCSLPDISTKPVEQITLIAEKYSEFLLFINEGYAKDDIMKILKKNVKVSDDPNDHLFLENFLVFYTMLSTEYKKTKALKEKYDQPMVRPTSVFRTV